MKRLCILSLQLFFCLFVAIQSVNASKLPDDVQGYLKRNCSNIDIRFDGVIILEDGTIYLPLYPASLKKPERLEITQTYPSDLNLSENPEVIIFNNDFVLLKVLVDENGNKTVKRFDKPPIPVKTGILPQDMLVPDKLTIPENIKGIVGNLDIRLSPEKEIKISSDEIYSAKISEANKTAQKYDNLSTIEQLRDKNLYMVTAYSKNITVVNGESFNSDYALMQAATPVDAALTEDDKFLIVTAYDSTLVNIISIADDKIIKQIDLAAQGGEIVMDYINNKAYVAAPDSSLIYVIDTADMTLTQRIKINGRCEKLTLQDDFLLYVDKLSGSVWSMEIKNNYSLKNLGSFPNISKIIFNNGRVYLSSRTKNRVAVLDYNTKQLLTEFDTVEKPVDMLIKDSLLYVLGAQNNIIHIINIQDTQPIGLITIGGDGFSTKFCPILNSNLVIVTDTKLGKYTIIDLAENKTVKTNGTELPVNNIIVGKKVKKIN